MTNAEVNETALHIYPLAHEKNNPLYSPQYKIFTTWLVFLMLNQTLLMCRNSPHHIVNYSLLNIENKLTSNNNKTKRAADTLSKMSLMFSSMLSLSFNHCKEQMQPV